MKESLKNESFVSVLTSSQPSLRGYCYAALGHTQEAEEALQRTNIVLWKKSDDWDPETNFMAWAITVAKYEIKGVLRDRKRVSKKFLFDADVAEQMMDSAVEVTQDTPSQIDALENCLSKVNEKNKKILTAFYFEGLPIIEISKRENKGESAIKVLLMRVRKSLRECIEMQMEKVGLS